MFPREMETLRRFLAEHPELLYGGVGAAALVSGGALVYKAATRYGAPYLSMLAPRPGTRRPCCGLLWCGVLLLCCCIHLKGLV